MFFITAALLTCAAVLLALAPLTKGRLVDGIDFSCTVRRRTAALISLVFIPVFSATLYLKLGQPQLMDMPLQIRKNSGLDNADFASLLTRLEAQMKKNPNDIEGWNLLAQNYRLAGESDKAVNACRKAMSLKGDEMGPLLCLGESLVEAQDGRVATETEQVFQKVLKKDKSNPEARFFLARAKAQRNEKDAALKDLAGLLSEAKNGAPWRGLVEREILRIEKGD